MFHFISPNADGTVMHIAIGANDINAAFEQFQRDWFRPTMNRSIGVWHNAALTHRVLPVYNVQTDSLDCFIQPLMP